MSIYRSYFEKNNTIVKDNSVNTAKNPVCDLFYGNTLYDNSTTGTTTNKFSRFILKLDLDDLKTKINNKEIPTTNTKHVLKIKNTQNVNPDFPNEVYDNKKRATSFDLIFFKIEQFWDEGIGYDYLNSNVFFPDQLTTSTAGSNWYNATNATGWTNPGIIIYENDTSDTRYTGITSGFTAYTEIIAQQHFDNGNEDISVDITNYINSIIINNQPNYGLGIAFRRDYENINEYLTPRYYSFYTKYTQTFFEPFLETQYDDTILDDRKLFFNNKLNRLYLYTFKNGIPYQLDQLPNVSIYDDCDNLLTTFSGTSVNNPIKGVYYISYSANSEFTNVSFTDKWDNIIIDGITKPSVEQQFTILDPNKYYSIGLNEFDAKKYEYNIYGIKQDERIKKGEKRKVIIENMEYFNKKPLILENLYYRLYTPQGPYEIDIIPFTLVNRSYNNNYIVIDTSWLIRGKYYLDFKVFSNLEERIYSNKLTFYVEE